MLADSQRRKPKKSDAAVVKWILTIGKKQIGKIVFIILVNMLWASLSVVFANFSKNVIDGAVVMQDHKYVIKYAVALFCIIMFQLLLNLTSNSMSERCRGRLDMTFKQYMLQQIMKKDYSKISAYHTGELQNRMFNDVSVISDGITGIVPDCAFYIVKLVALLFILLLLIKYLRLFSFAAAYSFLPASPFSESLLKNCIRKCRKQRAQHARFSKRQLSIFLLLNLFRQRINLPQRQMNFKR